MSLKRNGLLFLGLLVSIVFYQNCGPGSEGGNSGSSSQTFDTSSIDSLIAYEENLHDMLATSCASCHRSQSSPLFALDNSQAAHDVLVGQGLVNLASPRDSRIVQVIARGHENVSSYFMDYISDGIQNWADDLRRAGTDTNDGDTGPTGPEPIVEPTFGSIYVNILIPKCVKCHKPSGIRPREDYTSYDRTRATGGVVAGNANASRLYQSCLDRSMPDDSAPLNQNQLGAIRDWINDGALNN